MSENGTNSEDFHKHCDNKGPTLTLVKTTNNKIFGGFTPLNWNIEGKEIKDLNNQTFIFSLNLKKNIISSKKMIMISVALKTMVPNLEIVIFV